MAGIDDLFKSNLTTGVAVGIAAAVLTPLVVPILTAVAKPLLRSAIKGSILLYEKGREAAAELSEMVEDVAAEARAELAQAHSATAAGGDVVAAAEAAAAETLAEIEAAKNG